MIVGIFSYGIEKKATWFLINFSNFSYIYLVFSGTIVNIIEADKHVVNCVQENPLYPVLASSGMN